MFACVGCYEEAMKESLMNCRRSEINNDDSDYHENNWGNNFRAQMHMEDNSVYNKTASDSANTPNSIGYREVKMRQGRFKH